MKGDRPTLDPLNTETLPPCAATRSKARTLLEQLADLGQLPRRIKPPTRPAR